jgi:hypothetical protein
MDIYGTLYVQICGGGVVGGGNCAEGKFNSHIELCRAAEESKSSQLEPDSIRVSGLVQYR